MASWRMAGVGGVVVMVVMPSVTAAGGVVSAVRVYEEGGLVVDGGDLHGNLLFLEESDGVELVGFVALEQGRIMRVDG